MRMSGIAHTARVAHIIWGDVICACVCGHGVATISRLLEIIDLFYKKVHLKRLYSAKESYDFKDPTNCSHPICAT